MSWWPPVTFGPGQFITDQTLNRYLRDNISYLKAPLQTTLTLTDTGTVNDLAIAADVAGLLCNNASPLILTGIVPPSTGHSLLVKNIGTSTVRLPHQDTGSAAANRMTGPSVMGQTLGVGGSAWIWYDGSTSRWCIELLDPGAPIAVAHNAANFTAATGTWTVDVGDQTNLTFQQRGNSVLVSLGIAGTDVSATPNTLGIAIPGGFTAKRATHIGCVVQNAGVLEPGYLTGNASSTIIHAVRTAGVWSTTSSDNTAVWGQIQIEVL